MVRQPGIDRRAALVGAAAALVMHATPAAAAAFEIAAVERKYGGRLGVFVLDLPAGRHLSYRADERFKLQSTFKGLLAALVLADVDRGAESLSATVPFGRDDLLPASPMTEAAAAHGSMTVSQLCEAIMYRSDNTAANLLMARRGGPRRLTRYLRSLADHVTRVDNYEGHLADAPALADTTTPRAIIGAIRTLLFGQALAPQARLQLQKWMAGNVVGRARLRAAFPSEWVSGDRTGTGDGICNDYAFALRPRPGPLLVSAYHDAHGLSLDRQEEALRAVGRIAVSWQAG